jgi:hypothetical protein
MLLAGCGGTSGSRAASKPTTTATTQTSAVPIPAKYVAVVNRDRAACESAVQGPPGITAAGKKELAGLCFRINYIPEDNEQTVRAACEEAANASSLTSASARKRASSECYARGMVQ